MIKTLFSVFAFLVLSVNAAQSQIIHEQAYWVRLVARAQLTDRWMWQTEAESRRFMNNNQALQRIFQTHIHRKWGNYTEGVFGFFYSDTWPNGVKTPELRLFQDIYAYQSLTKTVRLSHRLRVEERWLHNVSKTELTDGYHFKMRYRYRGQVDWKINGHWILKLSDELMVHTASFDQNQAYIGLEYKCKRACSIELGYLNMVQKRSNTTIFLDRDNIRLTLIRDFYLR